MTSVPKSGNSAEACADAPVKFYYKFPSNRRCRDRPDSLMYLGGLAAAQSIDKNDTHHHPRNGVCAKSIWYLSMYPCPALLVPPKIVAESARFSGINSDFCLFIVILFNL